MKVYIVVAIPPVYDPENQILEVCASRDLAEAWLNNYDKQEGVDYQIEEWDVVTEVS